MIEAIHSHPRILRRNQLQELTGLSRSTIYLRTARGSSPKAISLGIRAAGCLESEVDEWLRSRVELSRG